MSRRQQPPRHSLSPSNPFASLDPALHPSALSSGVEQRDPSPSLSANRLTDFAQHVLGGVRGVDHDAENLLAFSSADDFIHHATQFGDLLEATNRDHLEENGRGRGNQGLDDGGNFEEIRPEGDEREVDGQLGDDGAEDLSMTPGRMGRKRKSRLSVPDDGDPQRTRKDNHKEVERRRRENINDGMAELALIIPGGADKMGKSNLLRHAVQYVKELMHQVGTIDEDRAKWEQEKADLERELTRAQSMLQEEHSRSLRFETTWREAEDRAAASQFELERVKGELENLRNGQ